ncbi:MAG: pentapeptide repeat-containing protein [Nannocystaceae bacterium]|nr:pentapeptide repeat-containing protein [Nannocystaceae bacterium]
MQSQQDLARLQTVLAGLDDRLRDAFVLRVVEQLSLEETATTLLRRPGVGPQMLARAVLWSNLVVGGLVACSFMTAVDRGIGALIAIACAVAIVRIGSQGLDNAAPGDTFQPIRFRGHLLLALVMAFADAQTLMFSAVMQLRVEVAGWNLIGTILYAGPTTIAAVTMAVIVWGLYRLRTWALIGNLVANITIAVLAADGTLGLSVPVAGALVMTAGVQMFIPVPIFAAALGDRKAGRPLVRPHATKLLHLSVIALAVLASFAAIVPIGRSGWLSGPGQAFRRGLEEGSLHYQQVRHLEFADYRRADIDSENFNSARLRGARFDGAHGSVDFHGADLTDASLRDAQLAGSRLGSAKLIGADFRGANLDGANLQESDLSRANFSGASLRFADLSDATLLHANFRNADLTGVHGTMPSDPAWAGATCPDRTIGDAKTGCADHGGHVALDDPRYRGVFEVVGGHWNPILPNCPKLTVPAAGIPGTRHSIAADGYLHFARDQLLDLGDGHFASQKATLVFDSTQGSTTVVYRRDGCGDVTLWTTQ